MDKYFTSKPSSDRKGVFLRTYQSLHSKLPPLLNFFQQRKQTKRVTTTRKKEKSEPLRSRSMELCGTFLDLLASVCKGEDTTIGLPYDQEEFWMKFAAKLNRESQMNWTGSRCELYAKKIRDFYLKSERYNLQDPIHANGQMAMIIDRYGPILDEIFQHQEYFSSWELTQVVVVAEDEETVPESPQSSSSFVKRAAQSADSRLPQDMEDLIQDELFELVKQDMLNLLNLISLNPPGLQICL